MTVTQGATRSMEVIRGDGEIAFAGVLEPGGMLPTG
jgi:hypothetical protein